MADYNDAIAARQDIPAIAYVGRGRVNLETGQIDHAIRDLDQAIAINANRADRILLARAQAWRRKGDTDRALDDLSRAITQAPKNEIAPRFARAQLFQCQG